METFFFTTYVIIICLSILLWVSITKPRQLPEEKADFEDYSAHCGACGVLITPEMQTKCPGGHRFSEWGAWAIYYKENAGEIRQGWLDEPDEEHPKTSPFERIDWIIIDGIRLNQSWTMEEVLKAYGDALSKGPFSFDGYWDKRHRLVRVGGWGPRTHIIFGDDGRLKRIEYREDISSEKRPKYLIAGKVLEILWTRPPCPQCGKFDKVEMDPIHTFSLGGIEHPGWLCSRCDQLFGQGSGISDLFEFRGRDGDVDMVITHRRDICPRCGSIKVGWCGGDSDGLGSYFHMYLCEDCGRLPDGIRMFLVPCTKEEHGNDPDAAPVLLFRCHSCGKDMWLDPDEDDIICPVCGEIPSQVPGSAAYRAVDFSHEMSEELGPEDSEIR